MRNLLNDSVTFVYVLQTLLQWALIVFLIIALISKH